MGLSLGKLLCASECGRLRGWVLCLCSAPVQEEEPLPQITLNIDLFRRSRYYPRIFAPRFTKPKDEGWWVVIGDPQRNELVAVKRIQVPASVCGVMLCFVYVHTSILRIRTCFQE